jgi:hypothetical protein
MLPVIKHDTEGNLFILWGDGKASPIPKEDLIKYPDQFHPGIIDNHINPLALCKYAAKNDFKISNNTLGTITKEWYNYHNPSDKI